MLNAWAPPRNEKPAERVTEFLLIAARLSNPSWAAIKPKTEELLSKLPGHFANPEFGVFLIKPEGAAYWAVGEFCDLLRHCDVPFVQAKFSTPLVGFLSVNGQKALQGMGVEFWNKDE